MASEDGKMKVLKEQEYQLMREKQSLMYGAGEDDGNTEDNTISAKSSEQDEFDSASVKKEAFKIY